MNTHSTLGKAATFALIVMVFISNSAFAKTALEVIPEDADFCLKISNIQSATADLDAFLMGACPIPVASGVMIDMQLGALLGNPTLEGINKSGDFAVFGTLPPASEIKDMNIDNMAITLLVPVSSYDKFISSSKSISDTDASGISSIASPMSPAVSYKIKKYDDYAMVLLAGKEDAFKSIKPASKNLKSMLNKQESKISDSGDIFGFADMKKLYAGFEPLLAEEVESSLDTMAEIDAEFAPMRKLLGAYINLVKNIYSQSDTLVLSVDFDPDVALIKSNLKAIEGTDLAKSFVKSDSAGADKLTSYLEENQAMTCVLNVNSKAFSEFQQEFIKAMNESGIKEGSFKKMSETFTKSQEVYNGQMAFSMGTEAGKKPPFTMNSIMKVSDAKKAEDFISESTELFKGDKDSDMFGIGLNMVYNIDRNSYKYKDNEITSAKLSFKPSDPNSEMAEAINMMYGDGFNYRWTFINDYQLMAASSDPDQDIKKLIDKFTSKSATEPKEIKESLDMIPDIRKSDIFGTYNYLRVLKMAAGVSPDPNAAMMAQVMSSIQTKSNLVFALDFKDGNATQTVALPKQHLVEMMQAVSTMMMMAPQMQQMPGQPQQIRNAVPEQMPQNMQQSIPSIVK